MDGWGNISIKLDLSYKTPLRISCVSKPKSKTWTGPFVHVARCFKAVHEPFHSANGTAGGTDSNLGHGAHQRTHFATQLRKNCGGNSYRRGGYQTTAPYPVSKRDALLVGHPNAVTDVGRHTHECACEKRHSSNSHNTGGQTCSHGTDTLVVECFAASRRWLERLDNCSTPFVATYPLGTKDKIRASGDPTGALATQLRGVQRVAKNCLDICIGLGNRLQGPPAASFKTFFNPGREQ